MNIEQEVKERAAHINMLLGEYLPGQIGVQQTVVNAMCYSVEAGGKRLRPMMMEAVFELLGGRSQAIHPFMAAIEFIHTYSLVHDDLPAMDNDEYRRGKKTTHVVYGEAMGILAGDALLNYAFETATTAFALDPGNPAVGRAMGILAGKAGIYGMVGGQVVDVESEGRPQMLDYNTIGLMYEMKTSALIEASMMIGAVLADATQEQVAAAEQIGRKVGMAFQIQDDILDVEGSFEELGKPIGSDARNGKATYVTLVGMDRAKADVERLSREAVDGLDALGTDTEFLRELFLYLIHRSK